MTELADSADSRPLRLGRSVGRLLISLSLLLLFFGLFQADVPLARFIRSLEHPIGYFPNPWLFWTNWIGNWVGDGLYLALFTAGLLAGGWWLGRRNAMEAGWQSLVAHGTVALLVTLIKHVVGRPRPKFNHAGGFQLWPSIDNGFDSFPSGHAAASFAVAAVLARRYPSARWLWYGAAAFVAFSRILRGSHFVTDVMAGAILGLVAGWIISRPLERWQTSAWEAVSAATALTLVIFALLWTGSHPAQFDWVMATTFVTGTCVALCGTLARLCVKSPLMQSRADGRGLWPALYLQSGYLVGIGLLLATGSPAVIGVGALVLFGLWLSRQAQQDSGPDVFAASPRWRLVSEAALAASVLVSLVVIKGLQGLIPPQ
ncbi:MAG TPA: phosphatase PAP2 family protein [Nitrospiraceae bacterium]|nr:phosphatase PAP2 family protein [Nitrospiraceae bacterium]